MNKFRWKSWSCVAAVVFVLGVGCSPGEGGISDPSQPDAHETDADEQQEQDKGPSGEPPDCSTWDDEPAGLFLTWQQDPTSTMTIDWHTEADDPRPSLCFREATTADWTEQVEAASMEIPHLDRTLFRIELTGLDADTEYVFQAGEFEEEYRFRTMPEEIDDEPIRFATGGDVMHVKEMFEATNETIMEYDLHFISWGGDLAYADGGNDPFHVDRWEWFFDAVRDTLVYDDGRVVPIVLTIGNHEVDGGYYYRHDDFEPTVDWRQKYAPYFYTFFAFPGQPGYDVLDFGDYMSMVALDSAHTNRVEGAQTEWLESVLQQRHDEGVDHIFPLYHVAAFPSVRSPDDEVQANIRNHWVPLFEEYGVDVVFEKHDHAYKRTHPIRDGEIDEDDGIVYIGDGAWGVFTRVGESQNEWYIDEYQSIRHGIVVTLQGDDFHALMVSEDGEIIDEYGDEL